jgi:hypothetical protein
MASHERDRRALGPALIVTLFGQKYVIRGLKV